jgi:hypothetical protein
MRSDELTEAGRAASIVKAYYDGSGKLDDPGCHSVTLAGVFGPETLWPEFEDGWNSILRRHDADYLHMGEALHQDKGLFAGWERQKVNALIEDCISYLGKMRRRGLKGHACTVSAATYGSAKTRVPSLKSAPCICVGICVGQVLALSDIKPRCVSLFFDQSEEFFPEINHEWGRSKTQSNVWGAVATIQQVDMRHCPEVQASDLFAWLTNRHFSRANEFYESWYSELMRTSGFSRHDLTTDAAFCRHVGPIIM